MSQNRFLFILTFIIAVALRFTFLGWKPPHFDESINGWFITQIWDKGFYNYDPTNFHGPLYFYYLQLFELLFGRSVEVMRAATGLLSVACLYAIFAHRRFVGTVAYWAALLIAVSPAFVFYSRYAIHETLFIFSQVLFSLGFFGWRAQRNWLAAAQMIIATLILASTKETFFIFLGTWGIAVVSLYIIEKLLRQPHEQASQLPLSEGEKWKILQVSLAALVVLFALFSELFARPSAVTEFFEAFAVWSKTGSGKSGHEKPFVYWLQLLVRYEWPFLLALVIVPLAILRKNLSSIRILGLVGFGSWLAYSIIPYKTPWLIMGFLWPLAFVFGWAAEWARNKYQSRLLVAVVALFAVAPLAPTYRLNFVEFTNESEPYIYVQSTKDINIVTDLVRQQVKRYPADFNMRITIMTEEGWPFPWIFTGYPNLQFMKIHDLDPQRVATADVIFYDGKDSLSVEKLLKDRYFKIPLHLRASYQPGFALFKVSKFSSLLSAETEMKGPK